MNTAQSNYLIAQANYEAAKIKADALYPMDTDDRAKRRELRELRSQITFNPQCEMKAAFDALINWNLEYVGEHHPEQLETIKKVAKLDPIQLVELIMKTDFINC